MRAPANSFTKLGSHTHHSLLHAVHKNCAEGVLCSRRSGNGRAHVTTWAASPIAGLVAAPVGMLAAVVELVASPVILLFGACFCCTKTGHKALKMGKASFLSGVAMLGIYPVLFVFGHTIGWMGICRCYAEGSTFDKLLHGKNKE